MLSPDRKKFVPVAIIKRNIAKRTFLRYVYRIFYACAQIIKVYDFGFPAAWPTETVVFQFNIKDVQTLAVYHQFYIWLPNKIIFV